MYINIHICVRDIACYIPKIAHLKMQCMNTYISVKLFRFCLNEVTYGILKIMECFVSPKDPRIIGLWILR